MQTNLDKEEEEKKKNDKEGSMIRARKKLRRITLNEEDGAILSLLSFVKKRKQACEICMYVFVLGISVLSFITYFLIVLIIYLNPTVVDLTT
jgi:hypothetical protein